MSINKLQGFLQERGWNGSTLINDYGLKITIDCENYPFNILVYCINTEHGEPNVVKITTYISYECNKKLNADKKLKLYEIISKANEAYFLGKVYVDDDGDIVITHSLPIDFAFVHKEDFYRAFDGVCSLADELYPEVMKLKWS